jgi:hypothetical protein
VTGMELFSGHKISYSAEGCTIILYADKQLYEFARDFDEVYRMQGKGLEKAVGDYIRNRLPDIMANEIKIMIGSILIASLQLKGNITGY